MIAKLYQTTKQNISLHIQNVYKESELESEATVKKYLTVLQSNKQIEAKEKRTEEKKMADKFLYEELDAVSKMGFLKKEIPEYLKNNLNPKFELRLYQIEAFARFFHCLDNDFPGKDWPLHFLFNMATGRRTTNSAGVFQG